MIFAALSRLGARRAARAAEHDEGGVDPGTVCPRGPTFDSGANVSQGRSAARKAVLVK